MGVRGLQSYAENNGCTRDVNIIQAIEEWKKTHDDCVIVVDMMGLFSILCTDKLAVHCGHRYWLLAEPLAAFFRRLRAAGASWVFFDDGPTQPNKIDVWMARKMAIYANTTAITDMHQAGMPLEQIAATKQSRELRMCPEKSFFWRLCAQFGPVHVAVDRECDQELAKYATDRRAMAIIAQDSDFLIFAGGWSYWSVQELDMRRAQTVEYDRKALRARFGFTSGQQVAAFGALLGNDVLASDKLHALHRSCGSWNAKFQQLAKFARTHFPVVDGGARPNEVPAVTQLAQRFGFDVQLFWQAFESYDVSYTAIAPKESRLWRQAFGSNMALILLGGYVKLETFCDFDLRHERLQNVMVLLVPLYRRLAGVVWHNQQPSAGDKEVRCPMRTRLSHESAHQVLELKPMYPNFSTPPLKTLLTEAASPQLTAVRYRLLAWVITGKETSAADDSFVVKIQALPSGYVLILLTLCYLTKMGQFTVSEADFILAAEIDVRNGRVPRAIVYPRVISAENVLLSRLYQRFFTYMEWAFELCGIEQGVEETLRFDSVHFHKCRAEAQDGVGCKNLANGRPGFAEMRAFYA